jgi:hypothetical protein
MIIVILEGRRIASVPQMRDGGGKSEHHRARCRVTPISSEIHAGGYAARRADGKCHREHTADFEFQIIFEIRRVRVKRWSKSPPLQAQARRHGKPHRVQGQIGDHGAARSSFRQRGMGPGYWLLRQMILSLESFEEDKIRLTALLKSFSPISLIWY